MAVKYIQKNKNGLWAISNSKTGKTLRTTNTQKEAIVIAGSTKTTEGIMIKRSSGWGPATGWDQQVANSTKSATTLKEEHGVTEKAPVAKAPVAKAPAAKKTITKKPVVKKAPVKKPVAKKAPVKKPVAKKAPVTAAPVKKAPAVAPAAKKPVAKKATPAKSKKGLPGWAGLLIGLLIIGVVVGGAFLLGYYL